MDHVLCTDLQGPRCIPTLPTISLTVDCIPLKYIRDIFALVFVSVLSAENTVHPDVFQIDFLGSLLKCHLFKNIF